MVSLSNFDNNFDNKRISYDFFIIYQNTPLNSIQNRIKDKGHHNTLEHQHNLCFYKRYAKNFLFLNNFDKNKKQKIDIQQFQKKITPYTIPTLLIIFINYFLISSKYILTKIFIFF